MAVPAAAGTLPVVLSVEKVSENPFTLREPAPTRRPMRIIEIFRRGQTPRSRAPPEKDAA